MQETARKSDAPSSQKRSDSVSTSRATLQQNGFGLALQQHNSANLTVHWPQTGLVYIGMELVSHPQLPPRIWPPKKPNIPQKWRKSANNSILIKKNQILKKTHFLTLNWAFSPLFRARPPFSVTWACGHAL
jgi:hypothetical protein